MHRIITIFVVAILIGVNICLHNMVFSKVIKLSSDVATLSNEIDRVGAVADRAHNHYKEKATLLAHLESDLATEDARNQIIEESGLECNGIIQTDEKGYIQDVNDNVKEFFDGEVRLGANILDYLTAEGRRVFYVNTGQQNVGDAVTMSLDMNVNDKVTPVDMDVSKFVQRDGAEVLSISIKAFKNDN